MKNKNKEEIAFFPLNVNGKYSKKDIRYFSERSWDLKSFFFSQSCAFRLRDKKLMRVAFRLWFDDVIKTYGKSKWIECIVFCRPEEYNKNKKQQNVHTMPETKSEI